MTFNVSLWDRLELTRQQTPTGRVYLTPAGIAYPSVTTVLSTIPKPALDQWKAAVGEQYANRVKAKAAARGTRIHNLAEKYVVNQRPTTTNILDRAEFKKIARVLDEHVTNVYASEAPLYSDTLKTAGTVDLICDWDGVLSVGDFKTSTKTKNFSEITHYIIQATAYAIAAEQCYCGVTINQSVLIIQVDHDEPQIEVFDNRRYRDITRRVFERYHRTVSR